MRARADRRPAFLVAVGILLSRIVGLVRERVFAYYFGTSWVADAFKAAFRIPNFLQNLFGEGVLSASFIPVYVGMLADGDRDKSDRLAGAIFGLLALVIAVLVLAGVLATPLFVDLVAAGYEGARRDLTIRIVRVLFPGAGLLVLSAWCLGILNSHGRFFLSYAAPVAWNLVMIASLVVFGRYQPPERLAVTLAWGSVLGSAALIAVQLPTVLTLLGRLRISVDTHSKSVREVVRNFAPVFVGRGVVQLSAYADAFIASFLIEGSVSVLTYAQNLYMLPVSLFGMAVSAAELPAMSGVIGERDEVAAVLRRRLEAAMRRIAFLVIPSAVAFLALGDVVAGTIYQTGAFKHAQAVWVWGILAGSAVGLLASTLGRLFSSTLYALRDTRTPLRFAIVRVTLTIALGFLFAFPVPRLLGLDPKWAVAGLTASAGVAGWVEFVLLRRAVTRRIGRTPMSAALLGRLWSGALVGAAAAWGVRYFVLGRAPLVIGACVLAVYGALYFGTTAALGVDESRRLIRRATGRRAP
jgi:putative peptidoglycan lipid II flippase